MAQGKDTATQERIDDAIARADEKISALLLATRKALNDDAHDQVALALATDEARRAIAELASAVVLPAEELLVSAQQTHRTRTKVLRDTVAKHQNGQASDAEVAEALRGTIESGRQVLDALQYLFLFYLQRKVTFFDLIVHFKSLMATAPPHMLPAKWRPILQASWLVRRPPKMEGQGRTKHPCLPFTWLNRFQLKQRVLLRE